MPQPTTYTNTINIGNITSNGGVRCSSMNNISSWLSISPTTSNTNTMESNYLFEDKTLIIFICGNWSFRCIFTIKVFSNYVDYNENEEIFHIQMKDGLISIVCWVIGNIEFSYSDNIPSIFQIDIQ